MAELSEEKKAEMRRDWRWWRTSPEKLTKLEQAYAIGCTDAEAIGYAEITKAQLYYYEKLNPEWKERKQRLKDQLILKAKQTIANELDKSYGTAMDYLKRRRRDEFGDTVDMTSGGKPIGQPTNLIVLRRMDVTRNKDNNSGGGSQPAETGSK